MTGMIVRCYSICEEPCIGFSPKAFQLPCYNNPLLCIERISDRPDDIGAVWYMRGIQSKGCCLACIVGSFPKDRNLIPKRIIERRADVLALRNRQRHAGCRAYRVWRGRG